MRDRAKRRLRRAADIILRIVSFGAVTVGELRDNDRARKVGDVAERIRSGLPEAGPDDTVRTRGDR